jgi:DNA-binding NarL/FixJ family response regulator
MKRLLIVEDEPTLREVYATLFKMHDYRVFEAINGEEALQQLGVAKPDIIILDALMPVMGGIEFLETAKLKDTHPDTRVLLLSNLSDPKTVTSSQKLGAHKYLLKARVSPAELVAAVDSMLEN